MAMSYRAKILAFSGAAMCLLQQVQCFGFEMYLGAENDNRFPHPLSS